MCGALFCGIAPSPRLGARMPYDQERSILHRPSPESACIPSDQKRPSFALVPSWSDSAAVESSVQIARVTSCKCLALSLVFGVCTRTWVLKMYPCPTKSPQ